jgi:D-lactate dehydrogenase (cytochrome)
VDNSTENNRWEFFAQANSMLPGRFSVGKDLRLQHANTMTFVPPQPPDAVVWPVTTEEVSNIVRLAAAHRVPVIAFGGGTSLEGHVNAPQGGVSIDFSKMNKILAVRPDDLDCTVEAGVTLDLLNTELRATGLFFPVDPGAGTATLGGMAATRASGTSTVRYGSMRENVINIKAVLASGEVVDTARLARKSASGYDLTRLLVGSEGTLGLITELTLKLHGVPEAILAATAAFPNIEAACRVSMQAIQAGLGVARIELLDAMQIQCVNAYSHLSVEAVPTLFLEFHGSTTACRGDFETFNGIAAAEGGLNINAAADEAGRKHLWQARHDAFWAVKAAWPGKHFLVTDIAVPLSKLAEAVRETSEDIKKTGLIAPIVGHVGDGNFHAIIVFDPDNSGEFTRVEAFLDRLVERALRLEGTATGEHGVGQGKSRYMMREHGSGVAVMRAIKQAIDPLNILNPGKIFLS